MKMQSSRTLAGLKSGVRGEGGGVDGPKYGPFIQIT